MEQYVVLFSKTPNNWCAHIPDLPGCVATGKDFEETRNNIREAIAFHLEGMIEDGDPIPEKGIVRADIVSVNIPQHG